jgi:RNA polymerase subunit RPABC4/transcription elongation factor Spt4
MENKKWICPDCKQETNEYPAISRKDNETEICPNCGVQEAILEFGNWFNGWDIELENGNYKVKEKGGLK